MARIRTIKPEFWRHPVMARQPDDVRLMAIALLNVADDDGYFFAEPALLRGEVWPFDEDSSRTRRVLELLSKIDWIEVYEHPEIGLVGKVVNFTKHQKVDRPSPSKIKGYSDSPKARRMFVDSSLLEQGTGNREQGTGKPPAADEKRPPQRGGGGGASDPVKEEIWATGRALLEGQGMSRERAGSFLGKLVKDYGQAKVLEVVRAAVLASPAEVSAWMAAACQERTKPSAHTLPKAGTGAYGETTPLPEGYVANMEGVI